MYTKGTTWNKERINMIDKNWNHKSNTPAARDPLIRGCTNLILWGWVWALGMGLFALVCGKLGIGL